MTLSTRKPTGLPSWPMVLLGGREKAGKTWAALSASTSPLIDRCFYIGIGEDDPDEYGLIPGVNFEIVEHDGTFRDILRALHDVAAVRSELTNMLVVDSMTKLWDLIVDNAQRIANQRANGRKTASGDYAISPDLWNVAANNWKDAMDAIRAHRGPSILTARLDEVMVMENGQPTKDKTWKVQAHKSLVFDAGVVVEMHSRGHALITGAKSVRMALEKPMEAPSFTIPELWQQLGITAESTQGERTHASTTSDDPDVVVAAAVDAWSVKAKAAKTPDEITEVWKEAKAAVGAGSAPREVLDMIRKVAQDIAAPENENQDQSAPEPLPGTEVAKPKARQWVREARAKTSRAEVRALLNEAEAAGVEGMVLDELAEIMESLPVEAEAATDEPWAPVASDDALDAVADAAAAEETAGASA